MNDQELNHRGCCVLLDEKVGEGRGRLVKESSFVEVYAHESQSQMLMCIC